MDGQRGQATLLVVGLLMAVVAGGLVLGGVAQGLGAQGDQQRAADLASLAGARSMHGDLPSLFEPVLLGGRPNPAHVELADFKSAARRAALATARRNGAREVTVSFPDEDTFAPMRIRVTVRDPVGVAGGEVAAGAVAESELAPPSMLSPTGPPGAGEYRGPFAHRQAKPMRPDVARAFDRLAAAARKAGHSLIVTSAFRSQAEQAALFARNPNPKWVAPPGRSLHRLGTELDLGPPTAYGWLAANAKRFGFIKRYSWEPWHFGYTLNAGSGSVGYGGSRSGGERRGAVPGFVPARFAPMIARAAQRWNVSAALLSAQIHAESGFNPFARSPAGARGIAQFMPGTAASYGLRNPFDPAAAIDAQAHLMRDLLRQFASVPLALAAYNAGPAPVQRCGCIPPYPETRGYVARILGLLGGAGEIPAGGGLEVRLVR
ncbi:MAG TPA: transglycosylase SLT domain-containing protein [Solirubrobacteraceae bacterium]|nr:transglycosylase SLT domain-containing protein [Solirubrobacteraceae bacterium]